jgi:lipopolysaccharide export system protein LptA
MVCKFRAASMTFAISLTTPNRSRFGSLQQLVAVVAAGVSAWMLCGAAAAQAPKTDRNQPMVMEADRSGNIDLQRQVLVYDGNAVITQGSMVMRADRIEVRQTADGYYVGQAVGSSAKPATWKQRRDAIDETVEGTAERIEFDGRADTLRFLGNSTVRRLRAGLVADEITGGTIVWDNTAEVFRVEGGAKSSSNPGGRVRAVLSPRIDPAASAASAAAPAKDPQATQPLTPSRSLGDKR